MQTVSRRNYSPPPPPSAAASAGVLPAAVARLVQRHRRPGDRDRALHPGGLVARDRAVEVVRPGLGEERDTLRRAAARILQLTEQRVGLVEPEGVPGRGPRDVELDEAGLHVAQRVRRELERAARRGRDLHRLRRLQLGRKRRRTGVLRFGVTERDPTRERDRQQEDGRQQHDRRRLQVRRPTRGAVAPTRMISRITVPMMTGMLPCADRNSREMFST